MLKMMNFDMLIELPDCLIVKEEDESICQEVETVVAELLLHVLKKHHEVHFGYCFLQWIYPKFEKVGNFGSLLSIYISNWHLSPIPTYINEYVRIVLTEPEEGEETTVNHTVHKIWYKRFLNGEPFVQSRMVTENSQDFDFYMNIGKRKKEKMNIHGSIKLVRAPGGGDTTSDVLKACLDSNHFTLCIIDSDKRYPKSKVGQTAKNCGRVSQGKKAPYPLLRILSCIEAENLLPIEVLKQIELETPYNDRRNNIISMLEQNTDEDKNEILCHYDLKDGLKKNPNFLSKPNWTIFAKKCCQHAFPDCSFELIVDELDNMENIMPGIHSKLLEKGISWLEMNDKFVGDNTTLLPFQEKEWSLISQHVIDYGFAPSEEAMNL